MRILQLIDSLRSGGAERMAVSYANALARRIKGSYLCCTREEGLLKKGLSPEVGYLFLNKAATLDPIAYWKLRKFIKKNKIDLIHAHGTSWFIAVLVKISMPGVKLVWHDHYGRELTKRKTGLLKFFSRSFDGIISVNSNLQTWAIQKLRTKNVEYFRNFLPTDSAYNKDLLKGTNDFRIVCVANFRPQKDHLTLLQAFDFLLKQTDKDISLHLIGRDQKDEYSKGIGSFISEKHLEKKVFIYGEQKNVNQFLAGADLGVLSSASEGLPVALLEYGKAGLPVVCTKVGECAEVIGADGKLVNSGDYEDLAGALLYYLNNNEGRKKDAQSFHQKVIDEFSEESIIGGVIRFYESLEV